MTFESPWQRRPWLAAVSGAALALLGRRPAPLSALHPHSAAPARPPRRVVTGLTSGGRSIILSDGPVPETAQAESPGQAHASELWIQRQLPPHRTDPPDPLSGYTIQAWPPPGGLLARIVTWEPGYVSEFHRSATLDIIFVITGQLQLQLEEGATTLGPGDSVIQRATMHAWRVVGPEACTFAGILIAMAE